MFIYKNRRNRYVQGVLKFCHIYIVQKHTNFLYKKQLLDKIYTFTKNFLVLLSDYNYTSIRTPTAQVHDCSERRLSLFDFVVIPVHRRLVIGHVIIATGICSPHLLLRITRRKGRNMSSVINFSNRLCDPLHHWRKDPTHAHR